MTTVTFNPASSFKIMDAHDRGLRFNQKSNGEVEVIVSSESDVINIIFEENIYVQSPSTEQQQSALHGLDTLTKDDRKLLLRGIEKGQVEVVPTDGQVSGVKKPSTVKDVFFRQVRSLTLKIPG